MASGYVTKEWKDRITEFPTRRQLAVVSETGSGMTVDVTRAEGLVSQEGDAYSAANMNGMEQRVKAAFDNVDTDVAGANSAVSGLTTRVRNAESNISGLTTRVRNAESNISGLTTRVRNAESNITKISGDLSGRLPNNVKIISEGSGANVKYYAQLGADTASKKALGRPQKYSYSNCLQGFKSENPSDMADSPATSCMVVYITNVPGYDSLTLDNLIIVTDFVSHESAGGCTYGYVYNAAVGRITIYPTSSNRFKRGNSGAATVYVMA